MNMHNDIIVSSSTTIIQCISIVIIIIIIITGRVGLGRTVIAMASTLVSGSQPITKITC